MSRARRQCAEHSRGTYMTSANGRDDFCYEIDGMAGAEGGRPVDAARDGVYRRRVTPSADASAIGVWPSKCRHDVGFGRE